jgi:Ribosomal protein S6
LQFAAKAVRGRASLGNRPCDLSKKAGGAPFIRTDKPAIGIEVKGRGMALYEHIFLARQDLSQAQVDALAAQATEIIEPTTARSPRPKPGV